MSHLNVKFRLGHFQPHVHDLSIDNHILTKFGITDPCLGYIWDKLGYFQLTDMQPL